MHKLYLNKKNDKNSDKRKKKSKRIIKFFFIQFKKNRFKIKKII